jgi:hypothetical protein
MLSVRIQKRCFGDVDGMRGVILFGERTELAASVAEE